MADIPENPFEVFRPRNLALIVIGILAVMIPVVGVLIAFSPN